MTIKPPTKVVELGSFANTRYEDNEIVKICVYTNGARIEASAKRCARVASIWPAPPKTPINVRMSPKPQNPDYSRPLFCQKYSNARFTFVKLSPFTRRCTSFSVTTVHSQSILGCGVGLLFGTKGGLLTAFFLKS